MGTRIDGSTIRLTGTVGDMATWYPGEEPGITSDEVNSALAQVGRTKDVTITLNSGGGIASEGAAIHAVLAAHCGCTGRQLRPCIDSLITRSDGVALLPI